MVWNVKIILIKNYCKTIMLLKSSKIKKILQLKNKQHGTTLVEVLIAIGIFSIFLAVAIGGFIQALSNQRIALKLMASTDNMSMTLEQISREVRVGKTFESIPSGFQFQKYVEGSFDPRLYKYELSDSKIKRTISNLDGSNESYDYITADNVFVSYFGSLLDNNGQPKVTLVVGITARDKSLEITNYIQSTISSRLITSL